MKIFLFGSIFLFSTLAFSMTYSPNRLSKSVDSGPHQESFVMQHQRDRRYEKEMRRNLELKKRKDKACRNLLDADYGDVVSKSGLDCLYMFIRRTRNGKGSAYNERLKDLHVCFDIEDAEEFDDLINEEDKCFELLEIQYDQKFNISALKEAYINRIQEVEMKRGLFDDQKERCKQMITFAFVRLLASLHYEVIIDDSSDFFQEREEWYKKRNELHAEIYDDILPVTSLEKSQETSASLELEGIKLAIKIIDRFIKDIDTDTVLGDSVVKRSSSSQRSNQDEHDLHLSFEAVSF